MKILNIYTDGGFRRALKCGSYAFAIVENSGNIIKEHSKVHDIDDDRVHVTNNTMEMLGVIKSLNWLKSNGYNPNDYRIYVYTDSQYVQLGITEWISNWKRNNWRNASRKPVKNKDLWIVLDKIVTFDFPSIHLQWTQGHDGNKWNEHVDKLCTKAMEEYYDTKIR